MVNKLKINLVLVFIIFFSFLTSELQAFEPAQDASQKEIINFVNDYNKVLEKNDLLTLSKFYDINYKNSDGYNLIELLSMIDKTSKAFDNIKYNTKITKIDINENSAVVYLSDKTKALLYPSAKNKSRSKAGRLYGVSTSAMYLNKDKDGAWKIVKDSILTEETSLKYGVAKRINFDFITPKSVRNGQDYEITLDFKRSENIPAIGSLSREEVNSKNKSEEVFKKISKAGALERLVKANENNKDEYAIANVWFTKVSLNEKKKRARIKITGMAYIMKRIPMDAASNSLVENK